ncbi:MAG: DNA cytosine methyltransferase [Myxococcales bacterium]|nr:DNA cytosine methyltransferase [Myxococcales bacterium]
MAGDVRGHDAGALSDLDLQAISFIPPGGNWRSLPEDFPSARVKQIREGAALGTGSRSSYYGRLTWDSTASTIATYFVRPGNGANIHPSADRTLTYREAARLQGFQDCVIFQGTRRARAMQIGNAVPPPVAAWLASALPARGGAVELFAGAGGLAAGIQAAGFETVAVADHDAAALRTLQSYLSPRVPAEASDLSRKDARERLVSQVKAVLGKERLALVAGGPPCQGFSNAGSNRLFEDPRNELPDAFLWMIQKLRPRQVLFENVAALSWKSRRPWFNSLLGHLEDMRYVVRWRVVHCEALGLPQRRRRLVVVGTDSSLPPYEFPTGPHKILEPAYRGDAQPELATAGLPPSVRDAIGDLPENAADSEKDAVVLVDDGNRSLFRQYVRGDLSLRQYVKALEAIK